MAMLLDNWERKRARLHFQYRMGVGSCSHPLVHASWEASLRDLVAHAPIGTQSTHRLELKSIVIGAQVGPATYHCVAFPPLLTVTSPPEEMSTSAEQSVPLGMA